MKKFATVAAIALLGSTSSAYANDFTGPRAELHLGLDALSTQYVFTDNDDGEDDSEKYRETKTGVLYGLGLGYDAQISSNIIAGIEANLEFSDTHHDYVYEDLTEDFYAEEIKTSRDIELAARAGYIVNPSTLIYVKAGYVNGRFKAKGEIYIDSEDEWQPANYNANRSGYRLGGGIETLLGSNSFAKLEYRYTNYKDWKLSYDDGEKESYGISRHQAVASVGIRF